MVQRTISEVDWVESGSVTEAKIRLASDEQPPEQDCGSEYGRILVFWSDPNFEKIHDNHIDVHIVRKVKCE